MGLPNSLHMYIIITKKLNPNLPVHTQRPVSPHTEIRGAVRLSYLAHNIERDGDASIALCFRWSADLGDSVREHPNAFAEYLFDSGIMYRNLPGEMSNTASTAGWCLLRTTAPIKLPIECKQWVRG